MYELLGRIYASQKIYGKAEEAFRKAISIDKNNLPAYSLLGQLYIVQNSSDKALRELQNAVNINPKSLDVHLLLGIVYESRNDREAAKIQYREALNIDPNSLVAANNLAYILAETGSNLDEALKLAQMAAKQRPEMPNLRDTLGWIYYKRGAYKASIEEFRDCVRKESKSATYQYHLGMSYYKNGDKTQAKTALSEALKLSSQFSGIEEAKQTLGKL